MTIPPLCIIQARMGSTRLPGKMLLPLHGETLIARAWRVACEAFGAVNVVVAIPRSVENESLVRAVQGLENESVPRHARFPAQLFTYAGDERDVLGRFHACAHRYRWHPDSIIVRYTPDDHRKDANSLRQVAAGERLPVEMGGEAFTLAMLDEAQQRMDYIRPIGFGCTLVRDKAGRATGECSCGERVIWDGAENSAHHPETHREHITHALFPMSPPKAPDDGLPWSIDTQADYDTAVTGVPRRPDDVAATTRLRQSLLLAGHAPGRLPRITAEQLKRLGLPRWDGMFFGMECE